MADRDFALAQIDLMRRYPILLKRASQSDLILCGHGQKHKRAITYQTLYDNTPSKIKQRGVRTKPPRLSEWKEAWNDDNYTSIIFNFKGNPSTTGNRQKGYVRFLTPDSVVAKAGEKRVDVAVFCTCPYFTYNLEYVLANTVTPSASEIRNSNGAAPRVRNIEMWPHLCKHLVHVIGYLD